MFLNASIRWAMSMVLALTFVQCVNAQGSHRVLAPPSNNSQSPALDPNEELIREVERFVNNSDSSLDIDPDEIDPELLEMAQRWAQQYQKPEDLPEDFKELIESLGAKLRDPENGLPENGLPPNTPPNQPGPSNRQPTPTPRNGEDDPSNPNNSLRGPDGNIIDPDLFEPPNFNDNGDPANPDAHDRVETQNRDPNTPTIQKPVGQQNGDPDSPNGSLIQPEFPNGSNTPNSNGPELSPGDIVPEGERGSESHRSEILDSLRDSDLTIKQQWNRILEQARRDAILNDNPASEENGDSALSQFLEKAFGESIGDAVDQTHQPGSRPRGKTYRGRPRTTNGNSGNANSGNGNSGNGNSSNGNSGNGNSGNGNSQFRNRDNPFLPNRDSNNNGSNQPNGSNNRNSDNPNGRDDDPDWLRNSDPARQNSNGSNSNNRNTGDRNTAGQNNSNRNANNSNRNNPRDSANREKGGFSKGMKDLANFGEDLFMKVANAEQPKSNDSQSDPQSPDGSNGEESSSAFSIQTPFMLLLILLVLAGCGIWLLKVRQQKIAVAAQLAAKTTRMPVDLSTKSDVLDAFHAMSAKTAAADAPWWTHRRAATELFESAPHGRHALEALTSVYEQARYLPGDEPLDPNELSTARKALTLYDHQ
jgi:hypothetical protein